MEEGRGACEPSSHTAFNPLVSTGMAALFVIVAASQPRLALNPFQLSRTAELNTGQTATASVEKLPNNCFIMRGSFL